MLNFGSILFKKHVHMRYINQTGRMILFMYKFDRYVEFYATIVLIFCVRVTAGAFTFTYFGRLKTLTRIDYVALK